MLRCFILLRRFIPKAFHGASFIQALRVDESAVERVPRVPLNVYHETWTSSCALACASVPVTSLTTPELRRTARAQHTKSAVDQSTITFIQRASHELCFRVCVCVFVCVCVCVF